MFYYCGHIRYDNVNKKKAHREMMEFLRDKKEKIQDQRNKINKKAREDEAGGSASIN